MTKCLILAAGFGTRLQPLTKDIPKPLFPLLGPTLLDIAIHQCSGIADEGLAINTHYLADQVHDHVNSHWKNLSIKISHEKTILETGGAVAKLKDWIGDSDLIIYNSDIVSNIQLNTLIRQHRLNNVYATMAVLNRQIDKTTPLYIKDDRVVGIGEEYPHAKTGTFSGVHIISSPFVRELPDKGKFSIIETYKKLANQEKIGAFIHSDIWHDMGTPRSVLEAHINAISHYPHYDQALSLSNLAKKTNQQCIISEETKSIYHTSTSTPTKAKNVFMNRELKGAGSLESPSNMVIVQESDARNLVRNENILVTKNHHLLI